MKMKELNNNTQKARFYIKRFLYNRLYSLDDCYKNCSDKKRQAYKDCMRFEGNIRAENNQKRVISGHILTYNKAAFTYGFLVKKALYIITPHNIYIIKNIYNW